MSKPEVTPPWQPSMFEALAEQLLAMRSWCTCSFPGEAAYDCSAYDENLDGAPWKKPRPGDDDDDA